MATTSPLSIPKIPNNLPQLPKPINKPIRLYSSSLSFSTDSGNEASSSSSFESISLNRRRLFEVGIVLLASSVGISDAKATRIEYYATVGEPLCDMNFAKSGLGYCDVAVGSGVQPPPGELINIHYTARFADGRVFDSSYKRGRPLTMRIGLGKVLPGLDQGILGGGGVPPMLVGGKRKLMIPPPLAYGPEPAGCFSDLGAWSIADPIVEIRARSGSLDDARSSFFLAPLTGSRDSLLSLVTATFLPMQLLSMTYSSLEFTSEQGSWVMNSKARWLKRAK